MIIGDLVRITADQPDPVDESKTIPSGTVGTIDSYERDGFWFVDLKDRQEVILVHESELETVNWMTAHTDHD